MKNLIRYQNEMKILGLDKIGLRQDLKYLRNLSIERLTEEGVLNGETKIGMRGAAMVDTGIYTGRSPNDKYFVEESSSKDNLWWGPVNRPINEDIFNKLLDKVLDYYNSNTNVKTYMFDGFGGADVKYRLPIRVVARRAWQAHFANNMFIRPKLSELENFKPEFTIINASDVVAEDFEKYGLNSSTFIMLNLERKIAIIGGTEYAGEMKKEFFQSYIIYFQCKMFYQCIAHAMLMLTVKTQHCFLV